MGPFPFTPERTTMSGDDQKKELLPLIAKFLEDSGYDKAAKQLKKQAKVNKESLEATDDDLNEIFGFFKSSGKRRRESTGEAVAPSKKQKRQGGEAESDDSSSSSDSSEAAAAP